MRLRSFFAAVVVASAFVVGAMTSADAAELRATTVVSSDVVTLGDLFDDAGDAGNTVVVSAPAPGNSLEISVSRISLAARRNGLAWHNTTGLTHVIVTRSGTAVPEAQVSDAIAAAIIAKTPSILSTATMQVDFTGGNSGVQVGDDDAPSVKVEQIAFNPRNGSFDAILRAPANDPAAPLHRVSGRAYPVTEVPVLAHSVAPGDVVHAQDIQWVRLPSTRVGNNIVTTQAGIVGMSPRYPVRSGEPVRISDMQPPVVIAKGATVDMNYVSGALVLLVRGRALESGAVGDTIDVLNPRSNRTVQGVIESPSSVRIEAMTAPHLANLKS